MNENSVIETSVVIVTYRRPDLLAAALASLMVQRGEVGEFEIIVVDNDAEGSALGAVEAAGQDGPRPIRYVRELRPGISHARNAGLRAARGRWLAFLDDDEIAGPFWLASLLGCVRGGEAEMAVGPVRPRFAVPDNLVPPHARTVYTRDAGVPTGSPVAWGAIGNSLFERARCFTDAEPFDPGLGLSGGEDAVFLMKARRRGLRMVWCAEAWVEETIPPNKITLRALLRRAFRGGQTTAYRHVAVRPVELGALARWMAIGSAQVLVLGPAGLAMFLLGHPRGLPVLARAAGGLGKAAWLPALHLRLYRSAPDNSATCHG